MFLDYKFEIVCDLINIDSEQVLRIDDFPTAIENE